MKYPWNKRKNDKGDSRSMEGVYAGPPTREPMGRVYAGPPTRDPMEEVYAGPPLDEPMMCVYAGPEYFNGTKSDGMGAFIPPEQMPAFCKSCGNPLRDDYKFCPACGAPVPKEDE